MKSLAVGLLVLVFCGLTIQRERPILAPVLGQDLGHTDNPFSRPGTRQSDSVDEGLAVPTKIMGKLERLAPEGGDWQTLAENASVYTGTSLRTGSDDSAMLALTGGGELYLGPDSELALSGKRIVLKRGSLKYRGESDDQTTSFETPDFVVQFSGERLELEYLEGESNCAILAGLATLRPVRNLANAINVGSGIQGIGGEDGLWYFEPVELSQKAESWEQIGWAFPAPASQAPSSVPADEPVPQPEEVLSTAEPSLEHAPADKPRVPIPIELPRDGSLPVLMLDSSGGFVLPRRSSEPELIIFADGRAIITDPTGKLPRVTRRLSQENLVEFLGFVVNQHHFYELTTEGLAELEAELQAGGQEVTDLPTTILRLGLGNKSTEVRCRGAEFWAEKHPEVQPFGDFLAIETRLRKFIEQSREWARRSNRTP
jgi:hypothetical protein